MLECYWSDKIAIVWTTEQVHRAANEIEMALTEQEAKRVLEVMFNRHDPQYGLKWEDITNHIQDRVLGRKLSKRELSRFIHKDILTSINQTSGAGDSSRSCSHQPTTPKEPESSQVSALSLHVPSVAGMTPPQ